MPLLKLKLSGGSPTRLGSWLMIFPSSSGQNLALDEWKNLSAYLLERVLIHVMWQVKDMGEHHIDHLNSGVHS